MPSPLIDELLNELVSIAERIRSTGGLEATAVADRIVALVDAVRAGEPIDGTTIAGVVPSDAAEDLASLGVTLRLLGDLGSSIAGTLAGVEGDGTVADTSAEVEVEAAPVRPIDDVVVDDAVVDDYDVEDDHDIEYGYDDDLEVEDDVDPVTELSVTMRTADGADFTDARLAEAIAVAVETLSGSCGAMEAGDPVVMGSTALVTLTLTGDGEGGPISLDSLNIGSVAWFGGIPTSEGAVLVEGRVPTPEGEDAAGTVEDTVTNLNQMLDAWIEAGEELGEPVEVPTLLAMRTRFVRGDGQALVGDELASVLETVRAQFAAEIGNVVVSDTLATGEGTVVTWEVLENTGRIPTRLLATQLAGWHGTLRFPGIGAVTASMEVVTDRDEAVA